MRRQHHPGGATTRCASHYSSQNVEPDQILNERRLIVAASATPFRKTRGLLPTYPSPQYPHWLLSPPEHTSIPFKNSSVTKQIQIESINRLNGAPLDLHLCQEDLQDGLQDVSQNQKTRSDNSALLHRAVREPGAN